MIPFPLLLGSYLVSGWAVRSEVRYIRPDSMGTSTGEETWFRAHTWLGLLGSSPWCQLQHCTGSGNGCGKDGFCGIANGILARVHTWTAEVQHRFMCSLELKINSLLTCFSGFESCSIYALFLFLKLDVSPGLQVVASNKLQCSILYVSLQKIFGSVEFVSLRHTCGPSYKLPSPRCCVMTLYCAWLQQKQFLPYWDVFMTAYQRSCFKVNWWKPC